MIQILEEKGEPLGLFMCMFTRAVTQRHPVYEKTLKMLAEGKFPHLAEVIPDMVGWKAACLALHSIRGKASDAVRLTDYLIEAPDSFVSHLTELRTAWMAMPEDTTEQQFYEAHFEPK